MRVGPYVAQLVSDEGKIEENVMSHFRASLARRLTGCWCRGSILPHEGARRRAMT